MKNSELNSTYGEQTHTPELGGYRYDTKTIEVHPHVGIHATEIENKYLFLIQDLQKQNKELHHIINQQHQQLADVAETNTKFLSIIAHDLRGPFCNIIGMLDLLKLNLKKNKSAEIESIISIAYGSTNSTLTLLDNLLAWTIAQNKEKCFMPVSINLEGLIQDEIENVYAAAFQKQIIIHHCLIPHLNVTMDLKMIQTVIRNLISNAIKFTHEGGTISINAIKSDQTVDISIEDNGVGLSPQFQHNLFNNNEFHSTEGTHHEKGTGLGLQLCKEFVEIHGGNIWVESEESKGCKITFSIPYNEN